MRREAKQHEITHATAATNRRQSMREFVNQKTCAGKKCDEQYDRKPGDQHSGIISHCTPRGGTSLQRSINGNPAPSREKPPLGLRIREYTTISRECAMSII